MAQVGVQSFQNGSSDVEGIELGFDAEVTGEGEEYREAWERIGANNDATVLPPRERWKECAVPLALLLEKYDIKLRRQRLKIGMCFYFLWLVLITTFSVIVFGSRETVLARAAAQTRVSLLGGALVNEQFFLLDRVVPENSTFDFPTNSPTLSPTTAPTSPTTLSPTLSPTSPTTLSPTLSPSVSTSSSPTQSPTVNSSATTTQAPSLSPTILPTATGNVSSASEGTGDNDEDEPQRRRQVLAAEQEDLKGFLRGIGLNEETVEATLQRRYLTQQGPSTSKGCVFTEGFTPVELFLRALIRRPIYVRSFALYDFNSYISFLRTLSLFVVCQPGDRTGICNDQGIVRTLRSDSFTGNSESGKNSVEPLPATESCLPDSRISPAAINTTDWQCLAVSFEEHNPKYCFAGFNRGPKPVQTFNANWESQFEAILDNGVDLSFCLESETWGQTETCFLNRTGEWEISVMNFSVATDGFEQRKYRIENTTTSQPFNQAIQEEFLDIKLPEGWYDFQTRSSIINWFEVNPQAGTITTFSITAELSLGGVLTPSQEISAVGGLTAAGAAESPSRIVAVTLLVCLILYVVVDLFAPIVRIFLRDEDLSTGFNHYIKYELSVWDFFDLVLLIVYCVLLVSMIKAGYLKQESVQFGSLLEKNEYCEVSSLIERLSRTRQVVGMMLFLMFFRLFKYMTLVPRLEMMWSAILKGIWYYTPPLLILIPFWLIFALAVLVRLHAEKLEFATYYNAFVAIVIMYGDSGSSSWEAILSESDTSIINLDPTLPTDGHLLQPVLFIFEFFIVFPFTAMSISAFYYAAVFTTTEYKNKQEQEIAEAKASNAQAIFNDMDSKEQVENLTGNETRLGSVLASDTTDLNRKRTFGATYGLENGAIISRSCMSSISSWCQGCAHAFYRFFTRVKIFCCGVSSVRESQAVSQLAERAARRKRRTKHKEALHRLQIYASQPRNSHKVLIHYQEIKSAIKDIDEEGILEIMDVAGHGNVYWASVKTRYETEVLAARARGEKYDIPSSTKIAEDENRRKHLTLENWQEETSEDSSILKLENHVTKLQDSATIAKNVLKIELSSLQIQQREMLRAAQESLTSLQHLKKEFYKM